MKYAFALFTLFLLLSSSFVVSTSHAQSFFTIPQAISSWFGSGFTPAPEQATFEEVMAPVPGSTTELNYSITNSSANTTPTSANFSVELYQRQGQIIKDDLLEQELYAIKNIANINCDESKTDFGKYCAGNKQLVTQLSLLSKEYLVPNNVTVIVNQAYRTWDIQYALFVHYGRNTKRACNPGTQDAPRSCPHMVSGAVDITVIKADGRVMGETELEQLMCTYGFVRYSDEQWHYEHGTAKWQKAEELRNEGKSICRYDKYGRFS